MKHEAKNPPFEVIYPVRGLASEGLPLTVGNIEFLVFDDAHIARFRALPDRQGRSPEQTQLALASIEAMVKQPHADKTVARVHIPASDAKVAISLGKSELRKTVDVINFYSDLVPYSSGHVYLPGDVERTVESIPVTDGKDKPSYYLSMRVVGPLGELSFKRLVERDQEVGLGFTRASALLARRSKGKLHKGILSAIQWAGRATVERRKEEAFLLYAIALESLLLIEGDKSELTYRLKVRAAHLLGDDANARKMLAEQIQKLYGKRSSIVHTGDIEVGDEDLKRLRGITKGCIVRVLRDPDFTAMTPHTDLVSWFDDRVWQ